MRSFMHKQRARWAVFYMPIVAALILALAELPESAFAQPASAMKIGIIGSGNIGGTVGELWVKAGHQVLFSSRNPEQLKPLVDKLGPLARAGTVKEALTFGASPVTPTAPVSAWRFPSVVMTPRH